MNLILHGLLQTSVFSIGFANGHCKYTSALFQCFDYNLILSQKNGADGASITFYLLFRRRRPRTRWESWQILWRWPLGYRDDEVRVSRVWELGRERENWLVEIAWTRACVKGRLLGHLISINASQNKEWEIMVIACWIHFCSWKIASSAYVSTCFSTTSVSQGGKTSSVCSWWG